MSVPPAQLCAGSIGHRSGFSEARRKTRSVSQPFVHLHLHSEHSLVDGIVRVPSLVDAVAVAGMPACAGTEQSNFFSLVKF